MPRARIERLGREGTQAVCPAGIVELVASIARHARRGRPLDVTAVGVFADGHSVPDELLIAGVRRTVADFAKVWSRNRADAEAEATRITPDEIADKLAVAEQLAERVVRENSPMVRRWRRNLRHHPPPGIYRANREDTLRGALTSVMRLVEGDAPDDGDSITELAAAAGSSGAFEKAPFADDPVVPEGATALRSVFAGYDIEALAGRAMQITADELRHGRAVAVPVLRVLQALPDPLRYYVGMPGFPVLSGDDPTSFVMLLLSFLAMSERGIDVNDFVRGSTSLGLITDTEAAAIAESARWLRSRSRDAATKLSGAPMSAGEQ
jgi:hypothetical protein